MDFKFAIGALVRLVLDPSCRGMINGRSHHELAGGVIKQYKVRFVRASSHPLGKWLSGDESKVVGEQDFGEAELIASEEPQLGLVDLLRDAKELCTEASDFDGAAKVRDVIDYFTDRAKAEPQPVM